MNTRTTSEQQAAENQLKYEAAKETKRQSQAQKQNAKMTSNLATQILLKNLPPIDRFTGNNEQDPNVWLNDIEDLFEGTKLDKSDRRRLLPMCFGEDVKKWYRSAILSSDYEEFKIQFLKAFTSPAYKLQISAKLVNRRQNNTESVQSYYYDILSLCSRFNPNMAEDEKLVYLLRGLKPSIQQQVIVNNPEDCQELLEQAKRIEATWHIVQQPDETQAEVSIEETTAALRRATISSNNYQTNEPARNSHRPSHHTGRATDEQRNWNYRSQGRQQNRPSSVICYNCNGVGHYAYQCPSHLN